MESNDWMYLIVLSPFIVIAGAVYAGGADKDKAISIKYIILILLVYFLALLLPSAGGLDSGKSEMAHGGAWLLMGIVFFWALPVSLPVYANILFFIALFRLARGKGVWWLPEINMILMLGSLLILERFGWGYILWLLSGSLLWAVGRMAHGGAKPNLLAKTVVIFALITLGIWQFGEHQRRMPEHADLPPDVVFISPVKIE